jgi:hypothetical protein
VETYLFVVCDVLCTCRFIIIEVKSACNPELLHSYHFFSFQDSQLLNITVTLFDNCVVLIFVTHMPYWSSTATGLQLAVCLSINAVHAFGQVLHFSRKLSPCTVLSWGTKYALCMTLADPEF